MREDRESLTPRSIRMDSYREVYDIKQTEDGECAFTSSMFNVIYPWFTERSLMTAFTLILLTKNV